MKNAALVIIALVLRAPCNAQPNGDEEATTTLNNINALIEYYNSFSNSFDNKTTIINMKSPAKNNSDLMATSNNALLYETPAINRNERLTADGSTVNPKFNFDVYPNPSTNDATVAFDLGLQSTNLTIIVTNEQGKLIQEKELNDISGYTRYHLPADLLTDGIYFVKVKIATDSYMKRLVMVK